MSNRLMILLTTISLVGSSVATGALAAPYHGAGKLAISAERTLQRKRLAQSLQQSANWISQVKVSAVMHPRHVITAAQRAHIS